MAKDTAYTVNPDDPRLTAITKEENKAIKDVDVTYGKMIGSTDKFYKDQITAAEDYGKEQTKIQNEALDLTIQGIEQDKAELKEDYTKEQSGAYVDWQKQSNQYGVNAEKMASAGLAGSGYSESSQVSMYNTYQNRVATARQTYVRAKADYDLAIAQARNQNSSVLAEIAYNTLQTKLQLSLEGFQYKNQLIKELSDKKLAIKESYWSRYSDTVSQIHNENVLAETIRANKADEDYKNKTLAETIRANKADEAYKTKSLKLEQDKFAYQKKTDEEAKVRKNVANTNHKTSRKTYVKKQTNDEKKINGVTKTTKKTTKGSGTTKINMQSVLDLGMGPVSAQKLVDLENRGIITSYVSGGQTYFKMSPAAMKQKQLYSRLG